ncbi:MAG: TetR family transcriptional regulator [Actinomycetota bacterium]|nr:TetR family transcriptional regulator [Actinomycetota bacterium]
MTAAGQRFAPQANPRPSYAQATRALLRERLLDAADDLLASRDWATVTMADIARGAGVSRQTLYNEFGSRQEFGQAYVLREADRFLTAAERAIAAHPDEPEAAVAAAFEGFFSTAPDSPLVRAIVTGDPGGGLLALVTTDSARVLAPVTDRLAASLCATWPQLPGEQAHVAADCAMRLAISHALSPTGPAELTARSVAALLGPYLEHAMASGDGRREALPGASAYGAGA